MNSSLKHGYTFKQKSVIWSQPIFFLNTEVFSTLFKKKEVFFLKTDKCEVNNKTYTF